MKCQANWYIAHLFLLSIIYILYKSKYSVYGTFNHLLCQKDKTTQSKRNKYSFVWSISSKKRKQVQQSRFIILLVVCLLCWILAKIYYLDWRRNSPINVKSNRTNKKNNNSSRSRRRTTFNNESARLHRKRRWSTASCNTSSAVSAPLTSYKKDNSGRLAIHSSKLAEDTIRYHFHLLLMSSQTLVCY